MINAYGIMDCYGVESFIVDDKDRPIGKEECFMKMRAMANAQRHALFYQVTLDPKMKEYVEELLSRSDYSGACVYIKTQESFINHGPGKHVLIPDGRLDPWG